MRRTKDDRLNVISDFYCTCCGHKNIPLVRRARAREAGHLKKIYCIYCQREENMVEIKSRGQYTLEDFLFEYNHGNFVNGQRKLPYKQFRAAIEKGKEV